MDPRVKLLTKREIELLHHVFLGRKTAEIAAIEGIAAQTVLNRLQEGRAKLGGVDRRTAALLVAEAQGWAPGIKPTPVKNTLSNEPFAPPSAVVSQAERPGNRQAGPGHGLLEERGVFVETLVPEGPVPAPEPRNQHDAVTRIGMLLVRTAILVAATVALLWVYGRN